MGSKLPIELCIIAHGDYIMKIESREFLPKQQASTHASTICFHPKGHPVFAWFEGQREGHASVFIRVHNLNGDGKSILIGDKDIVPRWNPVLFTHQNEIYLFEKLGEFCDRWQTRFHKITKWDAEISPKEIAETAQILPAGLNGPVKTKPLILDDYMVCGSSCETSMDWAAYIEAYSINNGKLEFEYRSEPLTVDKAKYVNHYGSTAKTLGIIQPALWLDEWSVCHAFFRSSNGLGKVYYSQWSNAGLGHVDYASKWTKPEPTIWDNPNSSVDVVYTDGRLFMVLNPVSQGRLPLVVVELDRHFNMLDSIVVTGEVSGQVMSQEASYPYMIEKDGRLHLTYTYGRSKIEYVQISIDKKG